MLSCPPMVCASKETRCRIQATPVSCASDTDVVNIKARHGPEYSAGTRGQRALSPRVPDCFGFPMASMAVFQYAYIRGSPLRIRCVCRERSAVSYVCLIFCGVANYRTVNNAIPYQIGVGLGAM